jgi:hypothetical protein
MPLTDLLSPKKKWDWGPRQEESFSQLKQLLSQAPVLAFPDVRRPFILVTDASDHTAGGILCQGDPAEDLRPCAYDSVKFRDHQLNWTVGEKEMYAGLRCMKVWRCYLLGQPFVWWTDHDNLRYWETKAELSQRMIRWLAALAEYDFKVEHIPGKSNPADALTRATNDPSYKEAVARRRQLKARWGHPDPEDPLDVEVAVVELQRSRGELKLGEEFLDEVKQAYEVDPWYQVEGNAKDLELQNGLWYKEGNLCIPQGPIRAAVLREAHDSPTGGHWGKQKTLLYLGRHFYWPGMVQDVKDYVRSCYLCQISKPRNRKVCGDPQPLGVPVDRWDEWTMDFMGGLPKSRTLGYDYVVVFVCRLSKLMKVFPCHKTITAKDTADLYLREMVKLFGVPSRVISDRDSKFMAAFWKTLMAGLGTKLSFSTQYHPESDGQTERYNRTLQEFLRRYIRKEGPQWVRWLWVAEFSYNNATQESIGCSPFELTYGGNPKAPLDAAVPPLRGQADATQLLKQLEDRLKLAKATLQAAQDEQAKHLARRRDPTPAYKPGDLVALSTEKLSLPGNRTRKFEDRWVGPLKVKEVRAHGNALVLELPELWKAGDCWNIKYIKPFVVSAKFPRDEVAQPPAMMVDGEEQWEVEQIQDARVTGPGGKEKTQYLVKYKGWGPEHNQWLREEDLSFAPEILDSYIKDHGRPSRTGEVNSDGNVLGGGRLSGTRRTRRNNK